MHELTTAAERYYQGEHGDRYRSRHLAVASDRIFLAIAHERARKLKPYIRASDRVFEYGVGSGFNLAALTCAAKVGYDLYQAEQELSRWGIDFCTQVGDVSAGYFDVVLCMHTLEHVVTPWEALAQMRPILRDGGRLIVCVPFEIECSSRRFDANNLHQHLYSWSVQTLGMLLTKAQYEIEEIGVRSFGYDRFTARLVRGSDSDLLYRFVHKVLLWLRPHYEVMAICRKAG